MDVEHVAVIGAGTMGSGIAQTFLQYGFTVTLIDQEEEQLERATASITDGLEKFVEKDDLSREEREEAMEALTTTTDMSDVDDADVILEAVPEDIDIKANVFQNAAEHNSDAIYASNTSSIPIAKLAEHAPDTTTCVGMHFFNPAPVMDIIELVVTEETDDTVAAVMEGLCVAIEKEVSLVKDVPGFVSNRILMPFINEAIKTLEQGIASEEDIDKIAEHGFNHPMGPLELADFIGLDVCLDIMDRMYEATGEDRFEPADLLREKVEEGNLGKKNGEGFYPYD